MNTNSTYVRNTIPMLVKLDGITNMQMRNRIKEHVTTLRDLLKATSAIEPDEATQRRLRLFFDYFEASVRDKAKLNHRASLLEKYGELAVNSMMIHRDKFKVMGRENNDPIEELFKERLTRMIEMFRDYHASGNTLDEYGLDLNMDILTNIVRVSADLRYQRSGDNLTALSRAMHDVTTTLEKIVELGGRQSEEGVESYFQERLLRIFHDMRGVKPFAMVH